MHRAARSRRGFSLIEILAALVIVGLLASSALPRFHSLLAQIRRRAALDLVVSELYHARMLAIQSGGGVTMVLRRDGGGCIGAVILSVPDVTGEPRTSTAPIAASSHCLVHTGDSVLHFNSRGMLRPPSRSIYALDGSGGDSAVVSVAGRVRRTY